MSQYISSITCEDSLYEDRILELSILTRANSWNTLNIKLENRRREQVVIPLKWIIFDIYAIYIVCI